MTFKEIQDLTLDQLQDVQKELDVTLTKIKKYINRAYFDFCKRTGCLQDSYDVTTVANQLAYDVSAALYLKIEHVRYIADSSEVGEPLRPYPGGFANLPREKSYGKPYWYWIRYANQRDSMEIGTWPIANVADKTLRVFGQDIPTALSDNADVPLVKEPYQDALVTGAVWMMTKAYAHKNRALRGKALDARTEYFEAVAEARIDFSTISDDEFPETVDVYC